jgi:membrane protease YdiL (CAAX protease family)
MRNVDLTQVKKLGPALGTLITAVVFALYHLKLNPIALEGKLWVLIGYL